MVTGILARNVIGEWRRQILDLYQKWEIPTWFLPRYMDDCTNIQRLLRVGVVWDRNNNTLRVCPDKRREDLKKGVTKEQTMADIWREMASSIIPGIRFIVEKFVEWTNLTEWCPSWMCRQSWLEMS